MHARQLPTSLPEGVESPRGKLVYFYLQAEGGATLDQLVAGLGLKRITLYGVLGTLEDRGLVEKTGDRYVTARRA